MQRFFFIDGTVHKEENFDNEMRFYQGWLGLRLSSTDGAIVIDGIADGSPSQKCGELFAGDKILALIDTDNERPVADTNKPRFVTGPRYLMPSDDTKWAVNEIFAADQAIRCVLEPVGPF